MVDFIKIATRVKPSGQIVLYPKFIIKKSSDLLIRGGDFYAIWLEDQGRWSTDESDALQLIDNELSAEAKKMNENGINPSISYLWDAESGMIDSWHHYCQRQLRDNYKPLDESLVFLNTETKKENYSSKRLPYPLEKSSIDAYDELIGTLYIPEERHKLEWAIGSIVSGDSKHIQKFVVLYGSAGTGKSTILNIMQLLFEGYYSVFDAKALGSSSNSFALEAFRTNPLVAIQHDGDLSHIEDNTRLNSLVSHEMMTVNEKFKSTYTNRFNSFLFMGTNKPVKITDAKSGLIRRLIDVSPSGMKVETNRYHQLMNQIKFELGGIAYHCLEVFKKNPNYYDDYIPTNMLGASNDFYNFVSDSYLVFKENNHVTLKAAWALYLKYCEDAKVLYPFSLRVFKEELKNYFRIFEERHRFEDGTRVRNYYEGFILEKFESYDDDTQTSTEVYSIELSEQHSNFDDACSDCYAQYATEDGAPKTPWDKVSTKLSDLDTSKLHYVNLPENHIVIDFDLKDETGQKNLELNLKAASKWPPTYTEVSKSGSGLHLHYFYEGDVDKLSRIYDENIEIKIFKGKSSLRRKLTLCNNLAIAYISSGLPLKGCKMINEKIVKDEKHIRALIKKNLLRQIHPNTKPSIDFIHDILEEAYTSGMTYDVTDLHNTIFNFAMQSSHQSAECIRIVSDMKFKSDDEKAEMEIHVDGPEDDKIVFFDVEVFKNLFVVCWKVQEDILQDISKGFNPKKAVVRMINPSPEEIEGLMKLKLVGFNNRDYDNHILYARMMGYDNMALYNLSQRIIKNQPGGKFREAYNLSYTDIYDFTTKKQSLKQYEIDLGIHHLELGLPWDEEVPEELWDKVAEYCCNDVIATEAVFISRVADFNARKILAEITGSSVNSTTNTLSTKFIFENNRHPQSEFNYRDMSDTKTYGCQKVVLTKEGTLYSDYGDDFTVFDDLNRPIFPGYKFGVQEIKNPNTGKITKKYTSTYRGEEVGEGGRVQSKPGIYYNVALLDIESMHPTTIETEELFGKRYTQRFSEIKSARLAIKHNDKEKAKQLLNGVLVPYLNDDSNLDALSAALKLVINSVYGLTAAKFDNPFKDSRNEDNIVAKRGALFMINLEHVVENMGYSVIHTKTDSVKIPNADKKIITFVQDYGKMYGYNFEHEASYSKMCLINKAVYIAKHMPTEVCDELYGYIPKDNAKHPEEWTATGAQFAVPYVFKTLFSKEDLELSDLEECKSVQTAIYLDTQENLPAVLEEENELDKFYSKKLKQQKVEKNDKQLSCVELDNNEIPYILALAETIEKGHDYHFVGKCGAFFPVLPGNNGGTLYRESGKKYIFTDTSGKVINIPNNINYASVNGTKDYIWKEAELMDPVNYKNIIDYSYYNKLVDDALDCIREYGDAEAFIS